MEWNLRVSVSVHQGDRQYMEDDYCVHYEREGSSGKPAFAYFGVFDGHGGPEAAKFTKAKLLSNIKKSRGFRSGKDRLVLMAIREGFLRTQQQMWKELPKWPRTSSGYASTAGTTATVAFLMNGKLYVGHVGDSALVVGTQEEGLGKGAFRGVKLTQDHKPGTPEERVRIERCGGHVITKAGVDRVAWLRPSANNKGAVRRSTKVDRVPFLAVSRALGDLWSYNYGTSEYTVSPDPDLAVLPLDPSKHRCIVLGSDGIWNVLSAQNAVRCVEATERKWFTKAAGRNTCDAPSPSETSSKYYHAAATLVARAHRLWQQRLVRADNSTAIVVMLDPEGSSVYDELSSLHLYTELRVPSGSSSSEQATKESPVLEYIRNMVVDPSLHPNVESDDLRSYQGRPTFHICRSGLTSVTILPLVVQTSRPSPRPTQSRPADCGATNKEPLLPIATTPTALRPLAFTGGRPHIIIGPSGLVKCLTDRPMLSLLHSGTGVGAAACDPLQRFTEQRQLQQPYETLNARSSERCRSAEEPLIHHDVVSEATVAPAGSLDSSRPTVRASNADRSACAATLEAMLQSPPSPLWPSATDPADVDHCPAGPAATGQCRSTAVTSSRGRTAESPLEAPELTECELVTTKAVSHPAEQHLICRPVNSFNRAVVTASAARCRGLPPNLQRLLCDGERIVAATNEASAAAASAQWRLSRPLVPASNNACSLLAPAVMSLRPRSLSLSTVLCGGKASFAPRHRPCGEERGGTACLPGKPHLPVPGVRTDLSNEIAGETTIAAGASRGAADLTCGRMAGARRKRRAATPCVSGPPPKLSASEAMR